MAGVAAEGVITECFNRNSSDNLTGIIIGLSGLENWFEEKAKSKYLTEKVNKENLKENIYQGGIINESKLFNNLKIAKASNTSERESIKKFLNLKIGK